MSINRRSRLSQHALTTLRSGQWVSEGLGYGKGSLQVRATPSGIRFYYRTAGERARIALGAGGRGPNAITLDQARDRCLTLAASRGSRKNCKARSDSLGELLIQYAERLQSRGSTSATKMLAMFGRHVQQAYPKLWLRSARNVLPEDIARLLEPLIEQDKLPTARKLRSSLKSAYQVAFDAPFCARSVAFRHFGVTDNPVNRVRPIDGGQR